MSAAGHHFKSRRCLQWLIHNQDKVIEIHVTDYGVASGVFAVAALLMEAASAVSRHVSLMLCICRSAELLSTARESLDCALPCFSNHWCTEC